MKKLITREELKMRTKRGEQEEDRILKFLKNL